MNCNFSRFCISCLGSMMIVNSLSRATNATENVKVAKQLNINKSLQIESDQTIRISKNINHSGSESSQREYLFKAPDNKIINDPQQLTRNQGYKVEVYGSADELLKKVKTIEPKAFRKGEIIQVGIFSEQGNAEILLKKLAVAGFWSRIVPE